MSNEYVLADVRYSRFLTEIMHGQQPFSVGALERKHGISVVGRILRDKGWTTKLDRGTQWIGPKTKDPNEVASMVSSIRRAVRAEDKKRRDAMKDSKREEKYKAFREAVKRMSLGPGGFNTEKILEDADIHFSVEDLLRSLHWIKPRKGSDADFWIGPRVTNDAQLETATRFLMENAGEHFAALDSAGDLCDSAGEEEDIPAIEAPNTMPVAEVPQPALDGAAKGLVAKRELSILWGLFKWTSFTQPQP